LISGSLIPVGFCLFVWGGEGLRGRTEISGTGKIISSFFTCFFLKFSLARSLKAARALSLCLLTTHAD